MRSPRVRFGLATGTPQQEVAAETRAVVDASSGVEAVTHHARLTGVEPDQVYVYDALHDGAAPQVGSFRPAPTGRAPFSFASFGDQGDGVGLPRR